MGFTTRHRRDWPDGRVCSRTSWLKSTPPLTLDALLAISGCDKPFYGAAHLLVTVYDRSVVDFQLDE